MSVATPLPLSHRINGRDFSFDCEAHFDIESKSELDLYEVGLDRYSRHPSTRIIMVSWKVDDGPIEQWRVDSDEPPPKKLIRLLKDRRVKKWAHNAEFERVMFGRVWKIKMRISEWFCTMTWAMMLGLPGALDTLGPVLRLPKEFLKIKEGKRLIRMFCQPNRLTKTRTSPWRDWTTDPEDWEAFCEYNKQDVVAEHFIATQRLNKFPVPDDEWWSYQEAQRTNLIGWPIDRTFVQNADAMCKSEFIRIKARLAKITRLDNPNSDHQFKPWAKDRGYAFGNMKAATVRRALLEPQGMHPKLVKALHYRAQLKLTSVKKFAAIFNRLNPGDDFYRFAYKHSGAKRTGRASGHGAQIQNLKKPRKVYEADVAYITECVRRGEESWLRLLYGDILEPIAQCVRSAARAPEGYELVIADLSSIETCVGAWGANCQPLLDVFRKGLDPYKVFATQMYDAEYGTVTKEQRNNSKPPMLGCIFRLSAGEERENPRSGDIEKTGLWGYAWNMGIELSQEEAQLGVRIFRESYPEIVQFWYDLETAAKHCIKTKQRTKVVRGRPYDEDAPQYPEYEVDIWFDIQGPFLRMQLPSGRFLRYLRPKLEMRTTPWGSKRLTITYEGSEDSDEGRKFVGRTSTHGGKLCENWVQATANDILRHGIKVARRAGFRIFGETHDELGTLRKKGCTTHGVEELIECMTDKADWMEGLPLKAAGFITDVFRKD